MRTSTVFATLVATILTTCPAAAADSPSERPVSPRLSRLSVEVERDPGALEAFWEDVSESGSPLVEPAESPSERVVTFLWKDDGRTHNVVIFSGVTMMWGFSAADLAEHQMRHLGETDIWYRTYRFPSDTRFAYYLSPNDSLVPATEIEGYEQWEQRSSTWRADPLNPKREARPHADRDWVVSIAELPDAPPKPWEPFTADEKGEVEEQTLESEILGSARRFWVYRPPGYDDRTTDHPLLVVFDGTPSSFGRSPGSLKRIIEYLQAKERIEAPVVVAIEQSDRSEELSCSDLWNDFLVTELMPWIRSRYAVTSDPARVVVAGGSLGGLAALCAALKYPDVFGNVLSTSGFVSWKSDSDYGRIMREYASEPRLPIHFYLDVGTFERDIDALLYANRHLRDVLVAKGYEVHYVEFSGGHDSTHTASGIAEGLQKLLPSKFDLERSSVEQDTGEEILRLEEQRVEAYRRADLEALQRVFSKDYITTNSYGEVRRRDEVLRDFREYLPSDQVNDDVEVRLYGGTAVVTGRTITRFSGGAWKNNHARFLRVWVREADEWRNVAFQGTFVLNRFPDQRQPNRIVTMESAATPASTVGAHAEVRKAENERLEGLRTNDLGVLERLLAPEYRFIDVFGVEHQREDILKRLAGRGRGSTLEDDDIEVRLYGNTAVVTGRTISRLEHPPGATVQTRFTRVWIRAATEWKLLVYQATHELARVPRRDEDRRRISLQPSRTLTNDPRYSDVEPAPSPDGALVVFSRIAIEGEPFRRLWIIPASGGEARPLTPTDFPWHCTRPSWSRDGRWIAFRASRFVDVYGTPGGEKAHDSRQEPGGTWVIPAAGGTPRQLPKNASADDYYPTVLSLGSCAKAFTATAVAMLVDEGKLSWDDPVVRHVPTLRFANDSYPRSDCEGRNTGRVADLDHRRRWVESAAAHGRQESELVSSMVARRHNARLRVGPRWRLRPLSDERRWLECIATDECRGRGRRTGVVSRRDAHRLRFDTRRELGTIRDGC